MPLFDICIFKHKTMESILQVFSYQEMQFMLVEANQVKPVYYAQIVASVIISSC